MRRARVEFRVPPPGGPCCDPAAVGMQQSRRGQRQKGQWDGPWLGSDVDGGGAGSDAGNPGCLRAGSDSRILLRLVLGIFASQKSTLNDEIGLGEIAIC